MADLWTDARPVEFFGIRAWDLTPDWQFLYLSCHAAGHNWNTLKWLADIYELCICAPLDWKQVKEKAVCYELDAVAEPRLAACSRLFGTPVRETLRSRPLPSDVRLFPDSLEPPESRLTSASESAGPSQYTWNDSLWASSCCRPVMRPPSAEIRNSHTPSQRTSVEPSGRNFD